MKQRGPESSKNFQETEEACSRAGIESQGLHPEPGLLTPDTDRLDAIFLENVPYRARAGSQANPLI